MILLFDLLCKINWEKAIRLCLHKPLEAPTNPQKHGVLPHQIHSSSPHLWNSDPSGQLRWPQRHRLAQHGPNRPTLGRANDGLFSLMFPHWMLIAGCMIYMETSKWGAKDDIQITCQPPGVPNAPATRASTLHSSQTMDSLSKRG